MAEETVASKQVAGVQLNSCLSVSQGQASAAATSLEVDTGIQSLGNKIVVAIQLLGCSVQYNCFILRWLTLLSMLVTQSFQPPRCNA